MKKTKRKFNKKRKQPKFNKFFSYNNEKRIKKNFMYKNFERSNSYNSSFTLCNFKNTNFQKSTMKYCGFNGALFEGTEFKNANLRGSRFKGALFKNVIFIDTKLDKVTFENAKFENVIFVNSSLKRCKGIKKDTQGIEVLNSMPRENFDLELIKAIKFANQNKYIRDSEILIRKKGQRLNIINIIKLRKLFEDKYLIKNLKSISKIISNQFYTLSYLIHYLQNKLIIAI